MSMRGLCPTFAIAVHRFVTTRDSADCCRRCRLQRKLCQAAVHFLRHLSVVLCKVLFWEDTELGENVWLSGRGNIIVGAERIGKSCVIHHNVTFGMHLADIKGLSGKPKVGERVWVGPNSIIHGNIRIGNGVTILGGTALTKNIPDRCVVSGNPGKIVARDFDNSRLLDSTCYDVSLQTLKEWAVD